MSWSLQTQLREIRSIDAWRNERGDRIDYYVTLNHSGGRVTLTNDFGTNTPDGIRELLTGWLAALDAIDPAKGGLERYETEWPLKPVEDGEGS